MQSLTATVQQIDRRVKGILRTVDMEQLPKEHRRPVQQLRLGCNEIKLDIRDYEYAETRIEQEKWVKIAQHNLKVVETLILSLGDIFGPADVAELGAQLEYVQSKIV